MIYTAKWWNKGQQPDTSAAWESASKADTAATWNTSKAYQAGAEVTHQGQRYSAKWWTLAYGAPNSFRAGWSESAGVYAQLSVDSLRTKANNNPQQGAKDKLPPFIRAMQDGYAAMLCSPQFLYLKESPGSLDEFALASRLSYFLWSSMPDESLFKLARAGKLSDPAELDRQVERMLNDRTAAICGTSRRTVGRLPAGTVTDTGTIFSIWSM